MLCLYSCQHVIAHIEALYYGEMKRKSLKSFLFYTKRVLLSNQHQCHSISQRHAVPSDLHVCGEGGG